MTSNRNNETYYEVAWNIRKSLFQEMIKTKGGAPLDIIEKYMAHETLHELRIERFTSKETSQIKYSGKGVYVRHPNPPANIKQNIKIQLASRMRLLSLIPKLIDEKIDTIIELGSGYGINLFLLDKALSKKQDYRFISLEYSLSGQKIFQMLSGLTPNKPMFSGFVDHQNPVLPEGIDADPDRTFAYSFHSIEQIPELPEDYFAKVSSFARLGAHFEPFGFQSAEIAESQKDHLQYIEDLGYNRNLLDVFEKACADGTISETSRQMVISHFQLNNPTSLISWARKA